MSRKTAVKRRNSVKRTGVCCPTAHKKRYRKYQKTHRKRNQTRISGGGGDATVGGNV